MGPGGIKVSNRENPNAGKKKKREEGRKRPN